MSHSLNKIWIHAIWSTKKRALLINPAIENTLFQFISDQFRELGCSIRILNGDRDHIHCLFLLNPKKKRFAIRQKTYNSYGVFIFIKPDSLQN